MLNGVSTVILMNFAYVGILPVIFFRKDGRYNLEWWITAGPLFVSPIVIFLGALGVTAPWWRPSARIPSEQIAAALSVVSSGLISYTLGTHRIPLALWHQSNDAPRELVTWGAYKRIRHPFYASFILAQLSAVLFFPHPAIVASAVYTALILNYTASKEERRLAASAFGEQYRKYMARTGRFIPRFGPASEAEEVGGHA